MSIHEHIDSWKNETIFKKQKEINSIEINNNYPQHWRNIISALKSIEKKDRILDIGCGSGIFVKVIEKNFPSSSYFGVDYSEDAIKMAQEDFGQKFFSVKDVNEVDEKFISEYDVLIMNGFISVLPNGGEVLDKILSLGPSSVIVSRIKFTDRESYNDIYKAYNLIYTYEHHLNEENFQKSILRYGYTKTKFGSDTVLLKK